MAHSKAERDELEKILDKLGVTGLFEALSQIASEKESHTLENWGDRTLARRWDRLFSKFEKLAGDIDDPYFQ